MQSSTASYSTPLIYVINLPEATQRRAHVASRLKNAALNYEMVNGVKGSELSPEEISQAYDSHANRKHYRRALSVGEIGCYLSHRECWQKLLSSRRKWAVILEDDIEIENQLANLLYVIPENMNCDIVKLSDDSRCKVIAHKVLPPHFEWVTYKRIPNCTTGYIITRSGAEKLLSRTKIYRPIDIDMQFHNELNLKVCGIKPYPIWPNTHFESHIDEQGRGNSRKTFTRPWRNWQYRLQLFWQRTKPSMNIETIDQ